MDAIDRFLARLERVLLGPRRAKADMVKEIRDGLRDAADAHRRTGLDDTTAQHRALAEFGTLTQLAPALQAELAMTQARRTALLMIVVLAGQPLAWATVDTLLADGAPSGRGGPGYALVNALTRWTGTATIVACLVAGVLLTGPGARRLGRPTRVVRAVAALGYAACAVFAALGVALTLLGPAISPWTLAGLPTTALLLGAPLLAVGLAARRCRGAAQA